MRYIYALSIVLASIFSLNTQAQLNVSYVGDITYNQELSDIWGYVAPNGDEYGLVGVFNGVSVVDLTDPTNPTELFSSKEQALLGGILNI